MLIAPLRKHLILRTFVFNVGSGNLHDIVHAKQPHAKQPQFASLRCGCILVRESPADELKIFFMRRSAKTATRVAMPLFTRSAASGAPAPSVSSDTTMISAGATVSLTTSAHPAARRSGRRAGVTVRIAAAANATAPRIKTHLNSREPIGWSPVPREASM
jgi:hypothetical protein